MYKISTYKWTFDDYEVEHNMNSGAFTTQGQIGFQDLKKE